MRTQLLHAVGNWFGGIWVLLAFLSPMHGFRAKKMRHWFGGIWVSTCLHFVHGFRVEKTRKVCYRSTYIPAMEVIITGFLLFSFPFGKQQ
jgi:hypothetical protein